MIIGITGKAGSGKTALSNMFIDKYDLVKFDCDTIAKQLQSKLSFDIKVDANGFIDEKEQQRIINEFHPLVWNEIEKDIKESIKKNKKKDFLIETALPSDRFFDIVDISILIKSNCSKDRLKNDRSYNDEKIESIVSSQKAYDKYYNQCDFVINNDNDINIAFARLCDIYDNIKG